MKTRKKLLTSALLCLAFVAASHHGYGATIGFQLRRPFEYLARRLPGERLHNRAQGFVNRAFSINR